MRRAFALACLAILVAAAGCIDAEPARSIPLESVAPLPPPMSAHAAVIVGYELDRFELATPFAGDWDEETAIETLREMGYEPAADAEARAMRQGNATLVVVEPFPDMDGFWLNVSYVTVGQVFAPTLPEAQALADDEWREHEPHFLGTIASFESRTGWPVTAMPERTDSFRARLLSQP